MHILSFRVENNLNEQIELLAKKHDRSKTYVLRKAVEAYLANQTGFAIGRKALNSDGFEKHRLSQLKTENEL